MPPESERDFKRLAALLPDRRKAIAARYENKRLFATERGIERRMLYRIELGEDTSYTLDTLRKVEAAYDLEPGSLERTLAGGPLEPLPAAGGPVTLNGIPSRGPATAPSGAAAEPGSEEEAELAFLRLWRETDPANRPFLDAVDAMRNTEGTGPESWSFKLAFAQRILRFIADETSRREEGTALPPSPGCHHLLTFSTIRYPPLTLDD